MAQKTTLADLMFGRKKLVKYKPKKEEKKIEKKTPPKKAETKKTETVTKFGDMSKNQTEQVNPRKTAVNNYAQKNSGTKTTKTSQMHNAYKRGIELNRKAQDERWSQGKDKFSTGLMIGATESIIPTDLEKNFNHKNVTDSASYKAGKLIGNLGVTALTLGGAGSTQLAKKGATKLATNKLGTKATQKLATSKGVKALAEKSLKSAGKEFTEEAVKKEAEKVAKNIVTAGTKDLIMDSTGGVVVNNNMTVADGKKFGSKEWRDEMLLNSGLDLAIGGAINSAPLVKNSVKAVRNAKKLANAERASKIKPKPLTEYKPNLPRAKREIPQKTKVNSAQKTLMPKARINEYSKQKGELAEKLKAYDAESVANELKGTSTNIDAKETAKKFVNRNLESIRSGKKNTSKYRVSNEFNSIARQVKGYDELYDKEVQRIAELAKKDGVGNNAEAYAKRIIDDQLAGGKKAKRARLKYPIAEELKNADKTTKQNLLNFNKMYDAEVDRISSEIERANAETVFKTKADAEQIVSKRLERNADEYSSTMKQYNEVDGKIKAMEKMGYKVEEPRPEPIPKAVKEEPQPEPIPAKVIDEPHPEPIPAEIKNADEVNSVGSMARPDNSPEANTLKYGEVEGVPNATAYGDTTQGAQTFVKGDVADDVSKEKIIESVYEGDFAKVGKSNRVALDNAQKKIDENFEQSYNDFSSVIRNNRQATSEDVAMGYKLVTKFQQLGQEAKAMGDLQAYNDYYEKALDVIQDVCLMESETARTLQAMRLFNTLSPIGREKTVVKSVNRLKDSLKIDNVELKPELLENLRNAEGEQAIAQAKKQIMVDVWNQIPPNWAQKASAWRYLAMLGNPKTHIRNVLGNAIFVPVKGMRNLLATGLEKAFIEEGQRTKAVLNFSENDRKLIELGNDDFNNVKDWISGGSRYIEGVRNFDAKQFKIELLNKAYAGNSKLLEKEDEIFMGFAYKRAYAQYLKANGAKATGEISQELLDRARKYATDEALNSTYRDASALADAISKIKKYASMDTKSIPTKAYDNHKMVRREQLVKKGAGIAVEATMPFTKTPINILRRGIDYSPLGIVKSVGNMLNAKGNPDELIKAIENFSSGLTGTGIMLGGYFAGRHGFAEGSIDTTSDEGRYKQMMGEQSYSIRVGDYTYTMDWAVPSAMAFFAGVNLANETEDVGFEKALNVMSQITDPVFNLSMLSGINTVLGDTASSFKSTNAMVQTLENTLKSYLGQFVPTIGGQIARTLTPYKKSATSTKETALGRQAQSFLNQQQNKIPGLNLTNADYVDNWGRKDYTWQNGILASALQNLASPGNLKKIEKSTVDLEIERLGEQLPKSEFGSIVPKYTSSQDFTQEFDSKEYRMSEKQLEQFKVTRGHESQILLQNLFDTEAYKNMTPDEKKNAIADCYSQAKQIAIREFLKDNGVSEKEYVKSKLTDNQKNAFNESKMSVEKYDKLSAVKNSFTKDTSDMQRAYALYNAGANQTELAVMGSNVSDHRMETLRNLGTNIQIEDYEQAMEYKSQDENGRLSRDEIIAYLNSTNMSRAEKRYMYNALATWQNAWKNNPY